VPITEEEARRMAEQIQDTIAARQDAAKGDPDELLTSKQLAKRLGVTRRTLKRYTAQGLIRPVRRHQFAYLWDLAAVVEDLHHAGKCQDVQVPAA
jgi:hypothetical protein